MNQSWKGDFQQKKILYIKITENSIENKQLVNGSI